MQYYDLKKNWRKVKRHLNNKEVVRVLVRDFNKYTEGRSGRKFSKGQVPFEFESCDWWLDHRGRMPAYWQYVKHSACHWLVNFNLEMAKCVMPDEEWRILTSDEHSTVWNGNDLLFDFNFLALGVEPEECFALANKKQLPIGKRKRCYWAEHWRDEDNRRKTEEACKTRICHLIKE